MKNLVARTLATALAVLAFCAAVSAQTKQDDLQVLRQNFIQTAEGYRASLQGLATSYEDNLRKAKERQEALKGLLADGLITRVEFERSSNAVEEARARLDDVCKQIAEADQIIAAARKPVEVRAATADVQVARADPKWTTGNARIDGLIWASARRNGVDPYLVFCVMNQESSFHAGATSPVGASGLMQLMPATAARYGVRDLYDPAQNIEGGTRYLRDLLRLFGGRVDLALAGYNAGEGAVMRYGNRVPPYRETQNYVRTIGGRYARNTGVQLTAKTSAHGQ